MTLHSYFSGGGMLRLFASVRAGFSIVIGLAALAAPLGAGTPVIYKEGKVAVFEIDVPDFWSLRTGGLREIADPESGDLRDVSRVFGMTPNGHEGIWVGVISPHGVSDLDGAKDYLQEIGPFLVTSPQVDAATTLRVNDRPARRFAGQGQRDGKNVNFTVLTIDLPGNRVAIGIVIFEDGADPEPTGDINEMLSSIKAVR